MFNFEKLEVYKLGLEIVDKIYLLTKKFPKEELFALVNQLRRAAISIVLNIVEGSGRTKKDFGHFINMARTSGYECIACLEIAKRRRYINEIEYEDTYNKITIEIKMLSNLKRSIQRTTNQ
ncbi:MAG: four helix bundle protein [Patescibacteria group bacterium]